MKSQDSSIRPLLNKRGHAASRPRVRRLTVSIAVALVLALMGFVAATLTGAERAKNVPESLVGTAPPLRLKSSPSVVVSQSLGDRNVAGRVLASMSSVEGAHVSIRLLHRPQGPIAQVTSGPDGAFDLGGVARAKAVLVVRAPGFQPHAVALDLRDARLEVTSLAIELAACELGDTWRIVDGSNRPVEGALVATHLRPENLNTQVATQDVDDSGEFRICGASSRAQYSVHARGLGTYWLSSQDAPHGGVIQLVASGMLEAYILGADGIPREGLGVEVSPSTRSIPGSPRTALFGAITDSDGHVSFPDLLPGLYRVRLSNEVFVGARPSIWEARAGDSEMLTTVEASAATTVLLEAPATFLVSGTASVGGAPIAGLRIWIEQCALAYSGAAGRFSTTCAMTHGERRVVVRGHGAAKHSPFVLKEAEGGLIVDVNESSWIRGQVSSEGEGAARVRIRDQVTDASGVYAIRLSAGRHRISAYDEARNLRSREHGISVTQGEDMTLNLELEPRGTIRGHVVDRQGAPASFAVVTLRPAERTMRVNPDGSFVFKDLAVGDYDLSVRSHQGSVPEAEQGINVSAEGLTREVKIAVDFQTRSIKGKVTYGDGDPVVGAVVATEWAGHEYGTDPHGVSDAAGTFEFSVPCTDQSCRISAMTRYGELGIADLEASTNFVRITIPRRGSVRGNVLAPDNTEVHLVAAGDATLGVLGLSRPSVAHVREGGFFFGAVNPGSYELLATIEQKTFKVAAHVKSGEETNVTLGEVGSSTLLAGRAIRESDGSSVPRALCGEGIIGSLTADAGGHFELRSLVGERAILVSCRTSSLRGAVIVQLSGDAMIDVDVPMVSSGGYLGASYEVASVLDQDVLVIGNIDPAGPAELAGLHESDIVVAVDGLDTGGPIGTLALDTYLEARPPGATIVMSLNRAGQELALSVVLGRAGY